MHVFITGTSGYIGGAIAARLVDEGHRVSGLVRSPEKAQALVARGIEPIHGSLDDVEVLTDAARRADAVINAASADHPMAAATLAHALVGTGKRLIHTSGSSIVGDRAAGAHAGPTYDEDTMPEPLPERAPRVAIDRGVLAAVQHHVHAIVLCPTMIYGKGRGLHGDSVQVPRLIELAKEAGVARHVGAGLNIWSQVHIDDMAEAYLLALREAPAGSFLFLEQGEASYKDIARAIGRLLGYDREPEPWPIEAAIARWGRMSAEFSFGSNSRVRADRARRVLGWTPTGPPLLEDIEHGSYRREYGR